MKEKQKTNKGCKRAGIFFLCVALIVVAGKVGYTIYDRTHPLATEVLGLGRFDVFSGYGMEVAKPGEYGYRTIAPGFDGSQFLSWKFWNFRLTPCKDKSDDVYLQISFPMEHGEGEPHSGGIIIMRSPTRYYVPGAPCEYEAYSNNPDWMAMWAAAPVHDFFKDGPPEKVN